MKPRFHEAKEVLSIHLRELGLRFAYEYRFHPSRNWHADFIVRCESFRAPYFLIEIEGGIGYHKNPKGEVIRGGRHTDPKGYARDLDKYNAATALGFPVLRFSTQQVLTGQAKTFLKENVCDPASNAFFSPSVYSVQQRLAEPTPST